MVKYGIRVQYLENPLVVDQWYLTGYPDMVMLFNTRAQAGAHCIKLQKEWLTVKYTVKQWVPKKEKLNPSGRDLW
jgi:hypothetical protein